MMRFTRENTGPKIFAFFALAILLILPFYFVNAAETGLVPCGREGQAACTTCDAFALTNNVFNFLVLQVMPPLAVLFFVWAGILMLTAGAKPANVSRANTIMWNAVVGVAIIYGAWMITNTILQIFAGDSNVSRSWYKIECSSSAGPGLGTGDGPTPRPTPVRYTPTATPVSSGGTLLTCPGGGGVRASRCVDCKPIQYGSSRRQGPSVDHAAASLADFLNDRLSPALRAAGIAPLYYNDGTCPNSVHQSPAHFTGHAIDINGVDMATTNKICGILNNLGVRKHEPGTGYLGNSTNVYIVESRSCKGNRDFPDCNCPGNSPGGRGLHLQY